MTAASPPSLLITPDRRRRLQQQFEEARRLAAQSPVDFRRIHLLLADCLAADPGNILYLDALLANLKRRQHSVAAEGTWWQGLRAWFGSLRLCFPASPSTGPHPTLHSLWHQPSNVALYRQLAVAAASREEDQAELRFLSAARELAPDDIPTLRSLAQALTRQGRFEDAVGPWFAVLALSPGDVEAEQAVADLGALGSLDTSPTFPGSAALPGNVDGEQLLQFARDSQQAGHFHDAERFYAQAQSALGGDLALLEVREDLRLAKSQARCEVARRRATHDSHPRAQSLVLRLEEEHLRLQIEIYNVRAERLPDDWLVRLELGKRLKAAGNFSGAVQRLEEALQRNPHHPALLVELGECWQHLRQFAKALTYYEQAAGDHEWTTDTSTEHDARRLAHYRAGVLASALGQLSSARSHFQALAACVPPFRDVPARLQELNAANPDA